MKIATALELILRVIDMIVDGVGMAVEAKEKYSAIREYIQIFVDQDRDPTPEEWAALDAITKSNHERIQNS